MRIKTITCHDVYNHGASLQAYALQTYLVSQGHEVEIIDYKPPYLSGHYRLWAVNNPVYDKPFISQAYLLAKLPGRLLSLRRKHAFDRFTSQRLKLTRRYDSYEELAADPPEADVYIAGSDQIWNTLFPNGRDKAFYLAFAPEGKKKVAYAASFSTPDVAAAYRPFVAQMLKGLDRISIRERTSLPLAASLGRPDAVTVCDPVFLLSRQQWESVMPVNDWAGLHYLLVYDTEGSEAIKKIATETAQREELLIFDVSAARHSYADRHFNHAGPSEFISLVSGASFVISNSFHATAFALIFEKQFCVVERSEDINERMRSLLSGYGLQARLVRAQTADLPPTAIDYESVRVQLSTDISFSKCFLDALPSL